MSHSLEFSHFAESIRVQKYAHDLHGGGKETWHDTAQRVARHVLRAVGGSKSVIDELAQLIEQRKFMPGGRYLYATGRPYHQCQNCALLRAEDSRESWAGLLHDATMALMTGAGIGIDYSHIRPEGAAIRKTGGTATGPLALMQMVNECGRGIMQGGARRSAIWAGLKWSHADAQKFIALKNWIPEVRALKEKDFNFGATMDGTNISIQLDDEFFSAYHNEKHRLHSMAHQVYWAVIKQMLKTGEPGFSIDTGTSKDETLRNAPVTGGTAVHTPYGEVSIYSIVDKPITIWTGKRWAENVVFTKTMSNAAIIRVEMTNGKSIRCEPTHEFLSPYTENIAAKDLKVGYALVSYVPDEEILVKTIHEDGIEDVFCVDVQHPEHSFTAEGVLVSNCTEITSADDADICNLGSINLARIDSLEEMKSVVELGTAFLLAGTVYSDVPYVKIDQTRTKNRRLGLGLMGIHEWLLQHDKHYGPDQDLQAYMEIYSTSTNYAHQYCEKWDLSKSVKTRAIAPTGTIGILGETTTGCEPIFCAAYKRRYMKGQTWNYQYVLDPTAKMLVDAGMNPDHIEDAYSIEPERRVAFQVWLQQFVDHGISSTINLPAWGSETNNDSTVQSFGKMLIEYLPKLRGITCYPDGARGGQPLSTVSYKTAVRNIGQTFVEASDLCDITKGGTCGS